MTRTGALYLGRVHHARLRPKRHRLSYRIFMLLLDLDEQPRRSWVFARNKPALLSFRDADHGDGSDAPLKVQIEARIRAEGLAVPTGPMRVLSMPRVLGRGFNPLSVYYCHQPDGRVGVIVYEVNNTFGDRHFYVLAASDAEGRVRHDCDKAFFVSPFMDMNLHYAFDMAVPDEVARIGIVVSQDGAPMLTASFHGEARPLSDAALLAAWVTHPLQTLGVLAGIYWEGLKLLLKGLRWRSPKTELGARAPDMIASTS